MREKQLKWEWGSNIFKLPYATSGIQYSTLRKELGLYIYISMLMNFKIIIEEKNQNYNILSRLVKIYHPSKNYIYSL